MTAPDVLYRHSDGLYDATARAWSARKVQPLVAEQAPRPLHHQADCLFATDPITEVCPGTRRQRDYRATHPHYSRRRG